MLFTLFASKNKKLITKWSKDHQQMVILGHKVIAEYSKNNPKKAKKTLKILATLSIDHLMSEDIEIYKMLRQDKKLDPKTEKLANEFTKSFTGVKTKLMGFLSTYTRDEAVLDEEFFRTFNQLFGILAQRINFEERNLYTQLKNN